MDVARPRDISAFLASRPKDFESCLKIIKQYGNWLYVAERNHSPSELIKAIEDTLFHLRYCYYIYEEEETCEGVYFRIAYENLFPDLKLHRAKKIESKPPVQPLELDILEIIDQRYGTETVKDAASAQINSDGERAICASSDSDQCDSVVEFSALSNNKTISEEGMKIVSNQSVIELPSGSPFRGFYFGSADEDSPLSVESTSEDSYSAADDSTSECCGCTDSPQFGYDDHSVIQDKHWSDSDSIPPHEESDFSHCVPKLYCEQFDNTEVVDPSCVIQCHSDCEPVIKQFSLQGQTIDVVPLCRDSVSLDPIGQSSVLLRSMCGDNVTFGKDFVSVVRTGRSVKRYDLRSMCVPALAKDLVQLAGGW